jgi:hypothetical protein
MISEAGTLLLEESQPTVKPHAKLSKRLTQSLNRLIAEEDAATVRKLESYDDLAALASVVLNSLANSPLPSDRRMRMAIKGVQRFRAMVERSGGTFDTATVAAQLNTSDSAVHKMVSRKKLLAFKQNGVWAYPVAQFDPVTKKPLAGLDSLLGAFANDVDDDSIVHFCLSAYQTTGKSPLTLLSESFSVDTLANAAASLWAHGAR